MWNLPRQSVEPVFPALAGGFFSTEPPGKFPSYLSLSEKLCCIQKAALKARGEMNFIFSYLNF